jgi:hypothetical protein
LNKMQQQQKRHGLGAVKKAYGGMTLLPPAMLHGGRVRNYADALHAVANISKPAAMYAAKVHASQAAQGRHAVPLTQGALELIDRFGPADSSVSRQNVSHLMGGGFFGDLFNKAKNMASSAIQKYAPMAVQAATSAVQKYAPMALQAAQNFAMNKAQTLADQIRHGSGLIGGRRMVPMEYAGAPVAGRKMSKKMIAEYAGAPVAGSWLDDVASIAQSAAHVAPMFGMGAMHQGAPRAPRAPRARSITKRLRALKM